MSELAEWLREQMALRLLGTAQLAALAGVAPNTVTAWRTGRRAPSTESRTRLADIFDTDPETVRRLAGEID
ncbi:MAG: helix-turn-helix transcriptional regulator [Dehalococcoidia bacterium]